MMKDLANFYLCIGVAAILHSMFKLYRNRLKVRETLGAAVENIGLPGSVVAGLLALAYLIRCGMVLLFWPFFLLKHLLKGGEKA